MSDLRQAAQQAEPVATILVNNEGFVVDVVRKLTPLLNGFHDVYTAPPRREWVSLTDEEINELPEVKGVWWPTSISAAVLRAIRAADEKLKEKNHVREPQD